MMNERSSGERNAASSTVAMNVAEHDRVEDDRCQEWQRHVPQLAQIARAVDPRGVVVLGRDPSQTSEVNDHAAADTPDPDKDEAGVDPGRVAQPVRWVGDPDQPQE